MSNAGKEADPSFCPVIGTFCPYDMRNGAVSMCTPCIPGTTKAFVDHFGARLPDSYKKFPKVKEYLRRKPGN